MSYFLPNQRLSRWMEPQTVSILDRLHVGNSDATTFIRIGSYAA